MAEGEFRFYTSLGLVELTGLKAGNVSELLEVIRTIDESSIFYHTHRHLREYHFVRGEYSSDYAQWVLDSLQETALGEKLASVDILAYSNMKSLREAIVKIIEEHINSGARIRDVPAGREFHFCKLVSVIMPTYYAANNLDEFCQILKKVSINSLYFHLFESKLRLGRETNDFSWWVEDSMGDKKLADNIKKLDPYVHTLDELRDTLIRMIEEHENKQTVGL